MRIAAAIVRLLTALLDLVAGATSLLGGALTSGRTAGVAGDVAGELAFALEAAPAAAGGEGVRIPGRRAFAARRRQLEHGVELHPDVSALLARMAGRYGVEAPPGAQAGLAAAGTSRRRPRPEQ